MPRRKADSPENANGQRAQMRSIERITSILSYIGEHGAGTLPELSESTGLARSTVFRLCEGLTVSGLLERAGEGGYHLGPRLLYLALKGPGTLDLSAVAQPFMADLVERTGETAALSVIVGDARMYVAQVESPKPIRRVIEMRTLLPMYRGASGKALLGWLPESRIQRILSQSSADRLPEEAKWPLPDRAALLAELAEARRVGYAKSMGERVTDGVAVAAPILAENGEVLGSLAVLAPKHRVPTEKLDNWGPLVAEAAEKIAIAFGARHTQVKAGNGR